MTDLDIVRAMLKRAGIVATESRVDETHDDGWGVSLKGDTVIKVENDDQIGDRERGYRGFFVELAIRAGWIAADHRVVGVARCAMRDRLTGWPIMRSTVIRPTVARSCTSMLAADTVRAGRASADGIRSTVSEWQRVCS